MSAVDHGDRACQYVPGNAVGIRVPGLWLVVGLDMHDELAQLCHQVAERDGTLDSVLEALFAGGLAQAPDFAVCTTRDGAHWRVVFRGAAQVECRNGEWSRTLTCSGILVDQNVEASSVALRLGPAQDAQPLPMTEALMAVSELSVTDLPVTELTVTDLPVTELTVTDLGLTDQPQSGASVYDTLFQDDADPARESGLADPRLPPSEESRPEDVSSAVPSPAPSQVPAQALSQAPSQVPAQAPVQAPEVETPRVAARGCIESAPDFVLEALPSRQQPTQQTSVPPSRPEPQWQVTLPLDSVGAAGPGSSVVVEEPHHPAPDGVVVASAGLAVTSDDGAPSRTVSRAELRRRQLADSGGVTVEAKRCSRQHWGPASSTTCRTCGEVLPQQEAKIIPRPPLGQLVFETGDVVLLDRDAVLGRNPQPPVDGAITSPRLVKLLDPRQEVSSQHLLLSLRDWHVVATDLGSTNGTEVISPDGRRSSLVAAQGTVIEPGSKIVLAEILTIRFEAVS